MSEKEKSHFEKSLPANMLDSDAEEYVMDDGPEPDRPEPGDQGSRIVTQPVSVGDDVLEAVERLVRQRVSKRIADFKRVLEGANDA